MMEKRENANDRVIENEANCLWEREKISTISELCTTTFACIKLKQAHAHNAYHHIAHFYFIYEKICEFVFFVLTISHSHVRFFSLLCPMRAFFFNFLFFLPTQRSLHVLTNTLKLLFCQWINEKMSEREQRKNYIGWHDVRWYLQSSSTHETHAPRHI